MSWQKVTLVSLFGLCGTALIILAGPLALGSIAIATGSTLVGGALGMAVPNGSNPGQITPIKNP